MNLKSLKYVKWYNYNQASCKKIGYLLAPNIIWVRHRNYISFIL